MLAVLAHGIPSGRPPDPEDPGYAGFARDLAAHGYAAFWFDFRGCRAAPGDFSIAGWARDLGRALDALANVAEVAGLPRIVVGSSAGGAAAITTSADRGDVTAVATLAAPASFSFGGLVDEPEALVQRFRNTGLIRDPGFPRDLSAWWAEFGDVAPEKHVGAVSPRPVLVVHGEADETVPYIHAERLFAAAGEPKELIRIPNAGHQLRRDPRAVDALVDWLQQLTIPA
jgi:fermentation-respiration switch protein FrsA (DUF1100 family)